MAVEKRFVVYGQTLTALHWDGEGVPILALHGWLDNAASFTPLAAQLANPMMALDCSGHGHSDHRADEAATHLVDYVRDVKAVADQLGWQRFILMGHSMGAGIACLFAAACPEYVEKLVLIDGLGPLTTPSEKVASTLRQALDEMETVSQKRKPVYADIGDAIDARMKGFGGLNRDASQLLCERGLMPVPGGWTWRADSRLRLTSSLRMTEEQVEGFLRAITAPTCLVLAEKGMGTQSMFLHRTEWIKHLTMVRLEGRHHLHMENAREVAVEINRFLAS